MKSRLSARTLMPALLLFAGDLAMILLFTGIGSREHGLGLGLAGTVRIALPFLLAWTVFAWPLGSYRPRAYSSFRSTLLTAAFAWLPALPTGLALRLLMYGKPMFTVFAALALVFVYLFLAAWRVLFTFAFKRLR